MHPNAKFQELPRLPFEQGTKLPAYTLLLGKKVDASGLLISNVAEVVANELYRDTLCTYCAEKAFLKQNLTTTNK